MTDEIYELMEERPLKIQRSSQNQSKKIKDAKVLWLPKVCVETGDLPKKHAIFNMHRKIIQVVGIRSSTTKVIMYNEKNPIIEIDRKLYRWKEYVEKLFSEEQEVDIVNNQHQVQKSRRPKYKMQ